MDAARSARRFDAGGLLLWSREFQRECADREAWANDILTQAPLPPAKGSGWNFCDVRHVAGIFHAGMCLRSPSVSWSTEGDLWRSLICGEFLDPKTMLLQVGHSAANICIYLYLHVFSFKVNKNKNIPNSSAFLLRGPTFLVVFQNGKHPSCPTPREDLREEPVTPSIATKTSKDGRRGLRGHFSSGSKFFPFFLFVLLVFFWKTEAMNKKLGRWEIFGVIGNCVCFLNATYITYIYICLKYIFIISELKVNNLFQDDLWFGSNFGPECFCFSLMSPLQARFFVKNLGWTSKIHHFWASTQSPWMSRLAKLRWSFAKKGWCCEKTKRACEAQLWRRVGELYFPVIIAWEYEGSYVFFSRWMQICWGSKSMCLCYHGVGLFYAKQWCHRVARFPHRKKHTTLRGFTPPKKIHMSPPKKHFTKWNFIFQPIFCKGYVSFRRSMGILFSSQWYGGVHQWQTRSAFMFFLVASLELRNLIINSMMLWR